MSYLPSILVQSVGGLLDRKINKGLSHSAMFATDKARKIAGYVLGNETDIPAVKREQKIGLVYHGSENYNADRAPQLRNRGSIKQTGDGQWLVKVPTGIKNRRTYDHSFDWSSVATEDLHLNLPALKTGNSKVKKTAKKWSTETDEKYTPWAFNLPALLTCPMAGDCEGFCYALQGSYAFASVRDSRARTLSLLWEAYTRGGVDAVEAMLGAAFDAARPRKGKVLLRIHDSGDFFSKWYYVAMDRALESRKDWLRPYGYTKRVDLIDDALRLSATAALASTVDALVNA